MLTRFAACDSLIQFVPLAYAGAGVQFAAILRPYAGRLRFAPIDQLLACRGITNCLATRAPSLRVLMKYPG
jgi:hypothetical protein